MMLTHRKNGRKSDDKEVSEIRHYTFRKVVKMQELISGKNIVKMWGKSRMITKLTFCRQRKEANKRKEKMTGKWVGKVNI